jgi:hypothetical protein
MNSFTHSNGNSFTNDSLCSSWDEIDESDYKLASWVPDYYVTHCQGCNNKFSYRLRKHHCRNCGPVFCYKCADQFYPLPKLNLTAPVRVCYTCKTNIEQRQQNGNLSSSSNYNQNSRVRLNSNGSGKNFSFNNSPSGFLFSSTPPQFNSDMFNQHHQRVKQLNPTYNNGVGSNSSNENSSSRCNMNMDTNKFKKNVENGNHNKVTA